MNRIKKEQFLSDTYAFCVGLVMLFGSQGWFFIAGNRARLGFLAIGFLLIMYVAIKRLRDVPQSSILLLAGGFFAFLVMQLIAVFRHHNQTTQDLLFQLVSFLLFGAGLLIATSRVRLGEPIGWKKMTCLSALIVPGIYGVLRFSEQLAYYSGTSRGYGESELNPIGLAYSTCVLALVCLSLSFIAKGFLSRCVVFCVFLVVLLAPITSGSRGPLLFLILAVLSILAALWLKGQFKLGRYGFLLFGVPVFLLGFYYLFKDDFLFLARFKVLASRFESLFMFFTGDEAIVTSDRSAEARIYMVESYLNSWRDWIFMGIEGYSSYPHNQYLEWGIRFGFFGLTVAAFFTVVFLWAQWRTYFVCRRLEFEWILFYLLLTFGFLQSMTSLSFDVNRALFLGYGYFVGCMFTNRKI